MHGDHIDLFRNTSGIYLLLRNACTYTVCTSNTALFGDLNEAELALDSTKHDKIPFSNSVSVYRISFFYWCMYGDGVGSHVINAIINEMTKYKHEV